MAKAYFVQNGNVIDYLNSSGLDIEYNDIVVLGNRIGIAAGAITNGDTGAVALDGVFECPAASSDTFNIGTTLYYDTDNDVVTDTVGDVTVGTLVQAKADGDLTARVKLTPKNDDIPIMENQAASSESTVAGLQTQFNALLTKLKATGRMTADS